MQRAPAKAGFITPTITTVLLHALGTWLLVTSEVVIRGHGPDGARNAYDPLRIISIGTLGSLLVLWLKDGVLLFLGKIDLRGETIDVVDEDDEQPGKQPGEQMGGLGGGEEEEERPIEPPTSWRKFRTHLGTYYYYDPATEMVHYLSQNGKANYVVDPVHNVTLTYDSLEQLAEQMIWRGQVGYGAPPQAEAPSAAPASEPAGRNGRASATRRVSMRSAAPSAALRVDQEV